MQRILFLIWVGLLSVTLACDETTVVRTPPSPADPVRVFVESTLATLPQELVEHAEAASTGQEMRDLLSFHAKKPWGARLNGGIKYADLLEELYKERGQRKVFANAAGLRPRGEAVLKTLLEADRHALDPSTYHTARIQLLAQRLTESSQSREPLKFDILGDEAETLVRWLHDHPELSPEKAQAELIQAIVAPSGPSPLPRVTTLLNEHREALTRTAKDAAELEVLVADGALRYARDMKHFNLKRMSWKDLKDAGGSKVVIYGRLRATFEQMAKAEDVTPILQALQPPHAQYPALVDALARYRAIAAEGGWPTVSSFSVEPGVKGPRVLALRQRLASEGYLDTQSEPSDVVDQELIEAFEAFAFTHQFRTPVTDAGVWRSLNVPVARRIQQIETTIGRWRETHYEGEPDYVFVNIPDFHAEVYQNGVREMRFRVVVGNTERKCDPSTKKWVMPNATPIQVAEMDHLILNPFWNVPERIVDEELRPKFEKDPTWLEKNNYEFVEVKGGNSWYRQKPGPDNALGLVKFIFPNRHNTYMHDTPNKKYFNYSVRAFSHGCVRVHNPLDFAQYLLEKDGLATAEEMQAILDSGVQKKFDLKTKLPVFFEYYVVRVDEQGRAHFLADVYRLDQKRESDVDPDADSCTHRPPRASSDDGESAAPSDVVDDLGP